jgi:hypothetical protein
MTGQKRDEPKRKGGDRRKLRLKKEVLRDLDVRERSQRNVRGGVINTNRQAADC